ncbi:gamma-glutamylcyclotransferase family protein [Burkholderia gladioli]|uniref:gamma-glutamylcyclotransferase family protein n=1 Tax=Burkholderia gladioli TaxID=28095 RepID=UPI0016419CB2|nr:gamma-glutamylcyclotransferase family protein [Burkholderia gladioli]
MRHVFVYGTLRAGEINDIGRAAARHGIGAPRLLGSATLRGRLYDFGDYPGMVPGAGEDHVHGDVYAIDERLVPVLDEIEEVYPGVDGLFLSRQVTVELAGRRYDCLYYPVGEHSVAERPRIVSGDWVAHRLARQMPTELQAG